MFAVVAVGDSGAGQVLSYHVEIFLAEQHYKVVAAYPAYALFIYKLVHKFLDKKTEHFVGGFSSKVLVYCRESSNIKVYGAEFPHISLGYQRA